MVPELLITFLLSFAIGAYVADGKKEDVKQQSTPDRWPPTSQVEMMKTCGIVCGKDRIKTYDSLRGECHCK